MKNRNLLLLALLLLFGCKVPEYDYLLQFANNSDNPVYVGISDINDKYKDTTYLYINSSPMQDGEQYKFQSHDTAAYLVYIPWDKIYKQRDTVSFYIFDAKTLETIPWQKVTENYLVLQRYDLSLVDLKKLNWVISYPPIKLMKNMQLYPPYKEE